MRIDLILKEEAKSGEINKEKDIFDDENYVKTVACKEVLKNEIVDTPNIGISIPEFFSMFHYFLIILF